MNKTQFQQLQALARRIRREIALCVMLLEAGSYCAANEETMRSRLMQALESHRRRVRALLLLARRRLASKERWLSWLRTQCLIDENFANRYLKTAS